MNITTERLILRDFVPDDLDAYRLLMQEAFEDDASLEQHADWMTWTTAGYRQQSRLYQPPLGDYAVTLTSGELIGSVGLVTCVVPWSVLPDMNPDAPKTHTLVTPEFGLFWAIDKAHQQRGYAFEAAAAFSAWAYHTLNYRRLVAVTARDNIASQAVMRKLGMTLYENTNPDPFWFQVIGVQLHPDLR